MWKRRILWISLFLAAVLLYLFDNGKATLAFLCTLFFTPTITILLPLTIKKTSCQLTLPAATTCGNTINGVIRLTSAVRIPAIVTAEIVAENVHTGETRHLHCPLTGAEAALWLKCDHCGIIYISVECLSIRDIFGLTRRVVAVENRKRLLITPRCFQTEILLTESAFAMIDSNVYAETRPGNDPGETFGIREYIPGDSIKMIHWKLSQKSDRILVRELSLPITHQVLLLFDANAVDGATAVDHHILSEIFASLATALCRQKIAFIAAWEERATATISNFVVNNEDDLAIVIEAMLAIAANGADGASRAIATLGNFAHVAVVSTGVPRGLADIFNGSRVTIITSAGDKEGLQADGTYVAPFEWENYQLELSRLEL